MTHVVRAFIAAIALATASPAIALADPEAVGAAARSTSAAENAPGAVAPGAPSPPGVFAEPVGAPSTSETTRPAVLLRWSDLASRTSASGNEPPTREAARSETSSVNHWDLDDSMPPHFHRAHEELIVVIQGTILVTAGTDEIALGPGDALLVPRGTAHGGRVGGTGRAQGYSVFTPAFDGADRVALQPPGSSAESGR